jgi:hypothetical protein
MSYKANVTMLIKYEFTEGFDELQAQHHHV